MKKIVWLSPVLSAPSKLSWRTAGSLQKPVLTPPRAGVQAVCSAAVSTALSFSVVIQRVPFFAPSPKLTRRVLLDELCQITVRSSTNPLYFSRPFAQHQKEKVEDRALHSGILVFWFLYNLLIRVIILISAISKQELFKAPCMPKIWKTRQWVSLFYIVTLGRGQKKICF